MANNVKWLKLMNDMFEDDKIEYIESLPDGDTVLVVWIKILCLASKSNSGGTLMITDEVPYTPSLLAHKFKKTIVQVEYSLSVMQKLNMIDIVDDIINVSNWSKYQSVDELEKIREQTRLRVARYRENKKMLECNVTSSVTKTLNRNENVLNSYSNSISNNIENNNKKEKEILKKSQPSEKELIDSFEFPEDVKNTIYDWLSYKKEKHQSYKPTGLKTLLKKLKEDCNTNGDEYVIKSIEYSMTSNYSGIFAPRQDFNKSSLTSQKKTNTSSGYEVI